MMIINSRRNLIMANMYYEKDCDLGKLDGKKIAIVGYGS